MKTKTLKLTAILLIFAGVFTACNEKEPPIEPFLNVETTSITAPAEGGTYTIAVSSNGEWTAVVQDVENQLWLTLDNTSGTNNGVITVNIEENTLFETRSATIKIVMGNLSEIVVVKQEAAEEPCEDYPREIPFTEWLIPWVCFGSFVSGEYSGKVFIINNKEELEEHIRCSDWLFEVDFSKYTLLLARGVRDSWHYAVPVSLTQTSVQNFVMELTLIPTSMPFRTSWNAPILVERISDNINIGLIITTKDVPEHSVWRETRGNSYIELTFYPSINRVQVRTYPNPLPPLPAGSYHFFGRTALMDYHTEDDRMHFPIIGIRGDVMRVFSWIISYPAENEMRLTPDGWQMGPMGQPPHIFTLQTKFREI